MNSSIEYSRELAGSKDYQVLCANCNRIKKIENKEDRRA